MYIDDEEGVGCISGGFIELAKKIIQVSIQCYKKKTWMNFLGNPIFPSKLIFKKYTKSGVTNPNGHRAHAGRITVCRRR